MPKSLKDFHFSAEKAARILRQYIEERDSSPLKLSNRTGISYDTVGNILSGKVRDIKFEQLFKICVFLAVPIEVFVRLMIDDEDIDFADEVLFYSPLHDEVLPASQVSLSEDERIVPESVAEAALPAATPTEPHYPVSTPDADLYSRDELTAVLNRISHCHEQHMADMRTQAERQHDLICKLIEKG